MLRGKIEFAGKTLADVADAIEEALNRMKADMTSGFDRNEDSAFAFTVDGREDAFDDTTLPYL